MNEVSVALRIYEASSALDSLTSLIRTIVDQIETIGDHFDPKLAANIAADLARIACEYIGMIVARMIDAEA